MVKEIISESSSKLCDLKKTYFVDIMQIQDCHNYNNYSIKSYGKKKRKEILNEIRIKTLSVL